MKYILCMHPNNRVRELRRRAGMSQTDLARAAGISQPAISQIENDTRPLTIDWMRAIARILGCTPADLLSDSDNPDRLESQERELVQNFREADASQRELVRRVAEPVHAKGVELPDRENTPRRANAA